jgi:MurNAc alpha-1-phosphate uridylyltransferase
MKVMLLAAGFGKRLRPLTDTTPKPLLAAAGKPLIIHHLERLASEGVSEIVINVAYLGDKIIQALGDGRAFGLHIAYSQEGETPLETAGGIVRALPLLGDAPFAVINSDIWTDYRLEKSCANALTPTGNLGHLVLVPNPPEHPKGDFYFANHKILPEDLGAAQHASRYTFAGIAYYHPAFFADCPPGIAKLKPEFDRQLSRISASVFHGLWFDIGTAERLTALDQRLRSLEKTHEP